jgi:YD repeat-containing protein
LLGWSRIVRGEFRGPGAPNPRSANELTNLTYFGYSEARTYNNLLQLTRQTVAGVFDTEYVFPGGANNGQISASIDHISGQQVNYTYDVLKRLTAAATTAGTPWGEAYTYDGFGNLNSATATQGSGVNWANASDPATNRLIGVPYDANGNNLTSIGPRCTTTYDVENRMVSQSTSSTWIYDPSNKRVGQMTTYAWTLYFYDIFGKQIETVSGDVDYPDTPTTGTTNVYFGSRLIQASGVTVVTDRLGSVRANSNGRAFHVPALRHRANPDRRRPRQVRHVSARLDEPSPRLRRPTLLQPLVRQVQYAGSKR